MWRLMMIGVLAVVLVACSPDDLQSPRGLGYALKIFNVLALEGRDAALVQCRQAEDRLDANNDELEDWILLVPACNDIIDGHLVDAGNKLEGLAGREPRNEGQVTPRR